jgi:ABC-type transport system substrate-binding protein
VNAIDHEHDLVHGKGKLRVGVGRHLDGPVVGADQHRILPGQVVEFNPLKPSEITGDLAKRWDVSSNGLIYTFYLHDNVKWWDGKDLTAEDVVFSLKRMVEPGKPRPRVGLLRPYITRSSTLPPP